MRERKPYAIDVSEERWELFVLYLHRWAVERSIAWTARFRRLACDYESFVDALAEPYWLAFTA